MQAFYPSTSRQTQALLLLSAVVLLLHGLGLQSLSKSWSLPTPAVKPVQFQRLAAMKPGTDITHPVAAPPPAPPPAAKPNRPTKGMRLQETDGSATPPDPATTDHTATDNASTEPPSTAAMASTDAPAQAAVDPPTALPTPPVTAPEAAAEVSPAPLPAPAQASATTWLTEAQFAWPASTKLLFEVVGESKGIRYSADGDLVWQHDGQQYQLRQEVRHMLLGARSQTSVGALGAQGLQPLRFGDKYKQEQAAHFERDKNTISFSSNAPSQTLQAGAQDRLSVLAQLASLMSGSPHLRQAGQQLQFQVASARSADVWLFSVEKNETLKLPLGSVPTLKLIRLSSQPYAQSLEIWLSPSHGYLPAKVRIAQSNGDVLEQFLRKVETP